MGERLADANVLEGVLARAWHVQKLVAPLVETQEDGAQFRSLQDADVRIRVEPRNVLQRDGIHQVDLAR